VEAVPSRAEAVVGRGVDRPHQLDRRHGRRLPQRGQRLRAGDADRVDPRPALEAQERGERAVAERPVERPGREPVPGEQPLERRDVPARAAGGERAPAELRRRPEGAEGRSRLGGERRRRALEPAEAGERLRAGEPVDVVVVQPEPGEADLERRDVGAAGGSGVCGAGQGKRQSGEERSGESRAHTSSHRPARHHPLG
jgi:hypothetical protein